jgi:hypothetical protein
MITQAEYLVGMKHESMEEYRKLPLTRDTCFIFLLTCINIGKRSDEDKLRKLNKDKTRAKSDK